MKHWLILQGYAAVNTMYRKTLAKQMTYRSPKGNEKQIDYILTKRRYLKYNKDAEANDMIHMGRDQMCCGNLHDQDKKGNLNTTKNEGRDQTEKNIGVEKLELEKKIPRGH